MYRKDLRRVGLAHGQDSIERISRVRMGERICMAGDLRMGRGFFRGGCMERVGAEAD